MWRRVATCIAAALMLTVATTASAAKFTDVPETHSLNIEIEYLAKEGIISGYSDGTFKPNAPIAKKHIAKMLVGALELPTTNLKPLPYSDVPTTHAYYKEIAAAYTAGIFGDAENFRPESSISRAFMAKMIAKSFNLKSIAANAVTYKDVPTTNEFYSPIQLVTMNNIARGYVGETVHNETTYTFEPNRLLTRAHFSAFLARAMSLKAGDYTPDTRYTYFFEDYGDGVRTYLELVKNDSAGGNIETTWNVVDAVTSEQYDTIQYTTADGKWSEGIPETDLGTFIDYPFTIGLKYDDLKNGTIQGRQEVIDTKATVTLFGQQFHDVIVVRDTFIGYEETDYGDFEEVGLMTRYIYIAKGYGIIAYERDGTFYQWLSSRELR
ncbi:S-layer homology domain-containing protein [Caryophanon latum]|nr:S-layer homology domain-containing protein [Caryophanon latum]